MKACEELWDKAGGFINQGRSRPSDSTKQGTPPKSYLQFPSVPAALVGRYAAAEPCTGYVTIAHYDSALTSWIEKKVPGGNYGNLTEGLPLPHGSQFVHWPDFLQQLHFSLCRSSCQRPP